MNNQQNELEILKEEMGEVQSRLKRIETFLTSFEAGPEPSPILDDRFMEALELIKDQGKVTASELQRRLNIGFVKAGRIIDQMEFVGFVSPPTGLTKPREVYQDKIHDYLKEIRQGD